MMRVLVSALLVWSTLGVASTWPRPEEGTPLPSLEAKGPTGNKVTVKRLRLRCPAGDCIVYQKDGRLKKTTTEAFQRLNDWLRGFGGYVYRHAVWGVNADDQAFADGDEGDPRYNCHAFALSEVGMTPADWVNGVATPETEDKNPMDNFLKSYFELKKTYDIQTAKVSDFEESTELREGDVATFVAKLDGDKVHYVHAGKLVKKNDKWWLASKLGEAFPVVVTPATAVAGVYARQFAEVRVYRVKPRN